ncbi:MAG: hypothetical protein MUF15_17460 [Acidobacteria bacterium]|jgi:hypothetical protein|nr:hypothetical protein [Acidobacteriota bacterium]
MSDESKQAVTTGKQETVVLEMMVDESKDDKYMLLLPLSYGVEFSEVDGAGKNISSSPVKLNGTRTIIRTPGSPARWKLRVTSQVDLSDTDPTGQPVSVDGDGSGDGFTDWLMVRKGALDENTLKSLQATQPAGRTIILQQEAVQGR